MNKIIYNFTYHHNGSGGVFKAFAMSKASFIKLVKEQDTKDELRHGVRSVLDTAGNEVEVPDQFWLLPESTQFSLCLEREREKYGVGITVLRAE